MTTLIPVPARSSAEFPPLLPAIAAIARNHPERPAVAFGGTRWTYGELDARSDDLARRLPAWGVRPGGRVAVCVRPGLEAVLALLAILKAGAAYLPINPDYPPERIRSINQDAGPDLTLTQEAVLDQLGDALAHPLCLDRAEPAPPGRADPGPGPDPTTACIFYTSGSTGRPKGIPISHASLAYYVHSAIREFGFGPGDRLLAIAKFSFSISLFDLLGSLVSGAELVILPRDTIMDYGSLAAALAGATAAHLGPSLLKGLVRYLRSSASAGRSFPGLRHLSSGGDLVPADLLEDLKGLFPRAELYVIYGSTEIACMGCRFPVPRDRVLDRPYVGRPFPGTECALLREDGTPAPEGEEGEICFRGPGVMAGYLGRPDLTGMAFVDIQDRRFFRTGDLGRRHPGGNLEFLGRRDFQIKLRGQRIELGEVEGQLRRAPGVRDAVVALARVGALEECLVAYLVREDPDRFSLDAVRAHLRRFLPDYMVPAGWMLLDHLPLNENLKIARKDLPAPGPECLAAGAAPAAPRTDLERLLAGLWQEALGVERVGIHDAFFDLGGDSLMAMNLCLLAAEHGLRLPPSRLAATPTIAGLAAAGLGAAEPEPAREEAAPGPLEHLPPFILRSLTGRGAGASSHWNVSRMFLARRRLDPLLVERAFLHLGRHDAFRLRIEPRDGKWEGRILAAPRDTHAFRALDLSGRPEDERGAAMAEAIRDCQAAIGLATGPIVAMVLFDLGRHRPQELFFVVHHFAMDVVSWKHYWHEFDRVYGRLEAGLEPRRPAPPVSFRQWTEALHAHAVSARVERDARRWLAQDWSRVAPLPREIHHDTSLNTNGSAQMVMSLLPEAETGALMRNGVRGASAEQVLMAGLAIALGGWQGRQAVHFDRLVHGRSLGAAGLDPSATLGCLISYAPILLDIGGPAPAAERCARIAAQLEQAGDLGTHAELYRYHGPDARLRDRLEGLPRGEVLFNYRGRMDDFLERSSVFQGAYQVAGVDHDPKNLRLYPLAVSVDVVAGRLETRFVYSANLHSRASIEAVSNRYLDVLRKTAQAS